MLFTTNTTVVVPALTGAIMCMGVRDRQQRAGDHFARRTLRRARRPVRAAMEAGFVRFRPVLMTRLAMIIGMAPMAFGSAKAASRTRRSAARDRGLILLRSRH